MDPHSFDKLSSKLLAITQTSERYGTYPTLLSPLTNLTLRSGRGLFLSIEFVKDRQTKSTFQKSLPLASMLDNAIFARGVSVYSGFGKGTADGVIGDHILFSPPLNISSSEIRELVDAVKDGIDEVFDTQEIREIMST